ncbi:MAG TPA: flagellar biosynthetic protein FliO [Actinoplanes sp.]|nr:flagellar biosynthetic protein FliO [Actinoplanes sp.]
MFELVLRIGFSLLIVLGLMWGMAKLARRPLSGHRGAGSLSVLNRQQLGRASSIAVVRVGDKALIVGVTDVQVNLLGETDLLAFVEESQLPVEHRDALSLDGRVVDDRPPGRLAGSVLSPGTWRATLDFLRERTARR